MGRPRLPIGTWGRISVCQLPTGEYEARTRFRMMDGSIKHVRRVGRSRTAATNNLKAALSRLAGEAAAGKAITVNTPVPRLIDAWLEDMEHRVRNGTLSLSSLDAYRSDVKNHLLPAFCDLQTHELTADVVDRFIKDKASNGVSVSAISRLRSIMSSMCALAVRHKALAVNPVRDVAQVRQAGGRKPVRALTLDERVELLRGLSESETAQASDLPDLVAMMLATGVRIGEILALTGEEISADASTVRIEWHLVTPTGQGVVRAPGRKSGSAGLTLAVPQWARPLFRRRKLAAGPYPIFSTATDGWWRPTNASRTLRRELDALGFDWVTSHVFRKTVGTVLDEAGQSSSAVADQLGNTPTVAERHYRAPRVANAELVSALENMFGESEA